MPSKSPPNIIRARQIIHEAAAGGRATARPRRPDSAIAAARIVATARGRGSDEDYVAYLAALSQVASGRGELEISGVRRLASLVDHPDHGPDATAALRDFIESAIPRGPGRQSAEALSLAMEAVDVPSPQAAEDNTDEPADRPPSAVDLLNVDGLRHGLLLLLRAVREEPRLFVVATTCSVAYGFGAVLVARFLAAVVQRLWLPLADGGHLDAHLLALSFFAGLVIIVGRGVALSGERLGVRVMHLRLRDRERRAVTRRLLELPTNWHREQGVQHLVNAVETDTDKAWRPVLALPGSIGAVVILVTATVFLIRIDWRVGLCGLISLVLLASVNVLYLRSVSAHASRAEKLRSAIYSLGQVRDTSPAGSRRFSATSELLRSAVTQVRTKRGFYDAVLGAMPALGALAAIAALTVSNRDGRIIGDAVAVAFLFTVISAPLRTLGWLLAEMPGSVAAARRTGHILDAAPVMTYGSKEIAESPSLHFSSVGFSYASDRPILERVELEVPPGRLVAVVGSPGAGRSTLAMLAARRMDPTSGTVLLGGTDLRTLSRRSLDRAIAYVPPRSCLPGGSIGEAIRLGRSEIGDDSIWQALHTVDEDGAVAALPGGLEAPVTGWNGRSSRRRLHRLAVAQALVGRPQVLILDSSDGGAEFDVSLIRTIHEAGNLMVLLITNEANAIVAADQVVYLDSDGHVVARKHPALLQTSNSYAGLFRRYRTHPYPSTPPRENQGRWSDSSESIPARAVSPGVIELTSALGGIVKGKDTRGTLQK